METGLRGRAALVTAASQGLGKAVAIELGREGVDVLICGRREDVLNDAADEIRGLSGRRVVAVRADLSTEKGVDSVVQATAEAFGRIDILVNNAGGPPPGDFTKHDDAAWQHAFETNLMSAVRLIRASLPYLKESGRGRIINLTSTSVKQPVEGLILSNAIRAGVVGMAKTLATEFAPFGITVNNIAPGRILTDRIKQLDQARAEALGISAGEVHKSWVAQIPVGRYGAPEELAYLAVFLASDKASYITGSTIQVDGGMVRGML